MVRFRQLCQAFTTRRQSSTKNVVVPDDWRNPFTPGNLLRLAQLRRNGSHLSFNHVLMMRSSIGSNCLVDHHVHMLNTTVGDYSFIGPYCMLYHAVIGSYTSIAASVTVGAEPHFLDRVTTSAFPYVPYFGLHPDFNEEFRPCTVGSDVWIGARSIIMAGLSIGNGAVVGAGAVVTRDVEDYSIVAGVPARPLRSRFDDELVTRLRRVRWWEWPADAIEENIDLFSRPLTDRILEELERQSDGG